VIHIRTKLAVNRLPITVHCFISMTHTSNMTRWPVFFTRPGIETAVPNRDLGFHSLFEGSWRSSRASRRPYNRVLPPSHQPGTSGIRSARIPPVQIDAAVACRHDNGAGTLPSSCVGGCVAFPSGRSTWITWRWSQNLSTAEKVYRGLRGQSILAASGMGGVRYALSGRLHCQSADSRGLTACT
jgi:hypothetical protein